MHSLGEPARPEPRGWRGDGGNRAGAGAIGRPGGALVVVLFVLLSLLPVLGLGGCRRQPATSVPTTRVQQGGAVRLALVGEVSSLDPREADSPAERALAGLLFSALAGVDGRGEVFPDLAVGWAGGRGGAYWTVRLRPDAVWHDGRPVTCDDVLFSLRLHPEPFPGLTWQKVDSRTVRFFLSHPDAGFPYWLAGVPILPAHLLASEPTTGDAGVGGEGSEPPFGRRPVGTGPFRLDPAQGEIVQGAEAPGKVGGPQGGGLREITLLPHLRHHRGRPHLDGLVVRIYPSLAEATRAALRGEVDLGPVLPADAGRVRGAGWRVLETHQPYYVALAFNCERVPAELRRAMVLAIDRHGLAADLDVREATFALPLISWAYPPEVPWGPYDPAAARRLLDRAGEAPPLRLLVPRDDPLRVRAARLIAAYLGAAGLRVAVNEEEADAFLSRLLPPFDYELALVPEPFPANPDLSPLLHSGQIPAAGGGGNVFAYRQASMDTLLDRLRQELDPATRKSLVQQVADLLCGDVPFFPLWTERVYLAVRPGLAGPVASPYGWQWNVHDWWWQSR
ncbi:MAG: peptide ABC transporter substrate-binding protein [Bacillota bacterium]|nr:peptide ABC transporter substrate-binding protein [Bacillota bacterium]